MLVCLCVRTMLSCLDIIPDLVDRKVRKVRRVRVMDGHIEIDVHPGLSTGSSPSLSQRISFSFHLSFLELLILFFAHGGHD